jgi:RND family efflux transporter MFP subunit
VTAALQLTCNGSRRFDVSSCPVYCDGELYGPAPVFAVSTYGNRFGVAAIGFISEFREDLENTKSWVSRAAFNANGQSSSAWLSAFSTRYFLHNLRCIAPEIDNETMTLPQALSDGAPIASDLSALAIDRSAGSRRRRQLHRILVRVLLLAMLVGIGVATWLWRRHTQVVVETAVVYSVYPSQALTLLNATGYVVAQRKASVASKATGRLEWLGVLEGSKVHAGEVIARLESSDTQAMRDQAAANVQVAEANLAQGRAELTQAEIAFRRSEALGEKNIISESTRETAEARVAKARAASAGYEAGIAAAQANLRVSDVALGQTVIRAPFDGVVLTRHANIGDTITPFSQAVDTKGAVVTIADMDSLEVEADVAESSYLSIRVGQPVEVQLDAIPGERFEGVVNRMVPTVDRAKASFLVKIWFKQRDSRMLPEMSAKAAFLEREVAESERKPVLAVPMAAVVEVDGRQHLYIIEDGKARLRSVDLGAKVGDLIEVRDLNAGTRVVIRPPEDLADGRAVRQASK